MGAIKPICTVCLAGAVMEMSLPNKVTEYPFTYHAPTLSNKLLAIDYFRQGKLLYGYVQLCNHSPHIAMLNGSNSHPVVVAFNSFGLQDEVCVPEYQDDPVEWRKSMEQIAQMFEDVGC